MRHGEVNNPERILYGTLDGFGLTERGHQMANRIAGFFAGHPVARILSSPLQRAIETATPLSEATGIGIEPEPRIIEGSNSFQGSRVSAKRLLTNPSLWPLLRNPVKPSWGEPYRDIASRMMASLDDAWESVESGEVVLVAHQLPIWMAHRYVAGVPLPHFPSNRRCSLGSVTSFSKATGRWREVGYNEPAGELLDSAIDLGAV